MSDSECFIQRVDPVAQSSVGERKAGKTGWIIFTPFYIHKERTQSSPLARCNSDRRGAVRWTWLLTCPHLHLYLIQKLGEKRSVQIKTWPTDLQSRVQSLCCCTEEARKHLPGKWGLFSTLSIVSEKTGQRGPHSQSHKHWPLLIIHWVQGHSEPSSSRDVTQEASARCNVSVTFPSPLGKSNIVGT